MAGNGRHDTPRDYPRVARLNRLMREVLAEAIERLGDYDERLELVTVTGVDVDPDLRHATVYISKSDPEVLKALEESRLELQRQVARQTRIKRTPLLRFRMDSSLLTGVKVESILRNLREHASESDLVASTGEQEQSAD